MNGIVKKIINVVLLFVIAGLVYAIIQSIQQPVRFKKEKEAREVVAVQRLKDIRTLQVA